MNRPSIRQLTLVFLLALAFVSPLTMAVDVIPPAAPVSVLFVEEAGGGTLKGPDDQHLTLTLTRLRDYVTAFTDRPARSSWDVPNSNFFDNYSNRFADDPPNAVLSYNVANSIQPTNIVLTISNPSYDPKRKTVKYDAVRVQTTDNMGNPDTPFAAPITHASLTPKAFGRVALFIDDASTTYAVGDTGPAGGIVFYLTDTTGLHGLEAATGDQGSGFFCNLVFMPDGTSPVIGSGLTNTQTINADCTAPTAASIASSYNGGGYTDWYLPSTNELLTMFNSARTQLNISGNHWTSTTCNSMACIYNDTHALTYSTAVYIGPSTFYAAPAIAIYDNPVNTVKMLIRPIRTF